MLNWNVIYNRLFELIDKQGDGYFSGPRFIRKIQEFDPYCSNYPSTPQDLGRFGFSVTPLDAEIMEVSRTQGFKAAEKIQQQFERNEQRRVHRRQSSADRERYALLSMQHNLKNAIERHAARLAADNVAPIVKSPPRPRRTKA